MSDDQISKTRGSDQEEIAHLNNLLKNYQRRLRILEEQTARFGVDTPPHVIIELEEAREIVNQLNKKLLFEQGDVISGDKIIQDVNAPEDLFRPEYSVLRSKVRYVDANLAIRFADASQDFNILLGFLTLFLGSAISFAISFMTAKESNDAVLLGTATAFSILLSLIFSTLAIRSWIKAESAKKLLFESGDLNPNVKKTDNH